MKSQSFIPGYKNLITETLYQTEVDYATCNKAECNMLNQVTPILTPNNIHQNSHFSYQPQMKSVSQIKSHIKYQVKSPYESQMKPTYQSQSQFQHSYNQPESQPPYFVREKDGPFIPDYYSQNYKTDIPYKGAIFSPCIVSNQSTHKKCNPLVAYPYGVPQDVEHEKCTKCKGSIKCSNKKRQQKKKQKSTNKNITETEIENEIETEIENENEIEDENEMEKKTENENENENENEDEKEQPEQEQYAAHSYVEINDENNFFTCKTKLNGCDSLSKRSIQGENDLTDKQNENVQYWDVLDDSKNFESAKLISNDLISHPSNFKKSFLSPRDADGKQNSLRPSNDVAYPTSIKFNSNFPMSNGHSTHELFSSNFSSKLDSPYYSKGAQNSFTSLKKNKFATNNGNQNYDDVMVSHDIDNDINSTMKTHKPLYLKINDEYVRLYDNGYTGNDSEQKKISIEKLDPDQYDLGFNPFTTELNSNTIKMYNKNYSNCDPNPSGNNCKNGVKDTNQIMSNDQNAAVRDNSTVKQIGQRYLQKKEKEQKENKKSEDIPSDEEMNEEMSKRSDFQSELHYTSTTTNKSEQKLGKKIILSNTNIENELGEQKILTKRSIKKKKNILGTDNNASNRNKKAEKSHSKVTKSSNVRFDMPSKRKQQRICKVEQAIMEDHTRNVSEPKSKIDSPYRYKIMSTNVDDLFSSAPNRKVILADKKKVVKNNQKELKANSMSQASTNISKSPRNKKRVNQPLKDRVTNSLKSIYTATNKKKELQKGKFTADDMAKTSDLSALSRNKLRLNELNKKKGNNAQSVRTLGEMNNTMESKEMQKAELYDELKTVEKEENMEDKTKRKEKKKEEEGKDENETGEKGKMLLMRSTTKLYGKDKTVPFKSIHVRSYSTSISNKNDTFAKNGISSTDTNIINNTKNDNVDSLKSKDTLKLKKINVTDKKKKVETGKWNKQK